MTALFMVEQLMELTKGEWLYRALCTKYIMNKICRSVVYLVHLLYNSYSSVKMYYIFFKSLGADRSNRHQSNQIPEKMY